MFGENAYSQVVAWLKILLPLAALAILSSVVFFARESEDERTVPFVTEVAGEDVPEPRLLSPEFAGVSGDGSSVSVVASVVTPVDGNTQVLDADSIKGQIRTTEGRVIDSAAPEGRVDTVAKLAKFFGQVDVVTSDGYRFEAAGLTTRIDRVEASSDGPVQGVAPFGKLDAGSMEIRHVPDSGNVMHFNDGVRLIYEPRSR